MTIVTNEQPVRTRELLYLQGGCLSVTSRILIVDLLSKHCPASLVSGLVVADAHQCSESSVEAFILRVFRQNNRTGFIKAVSDQPLAFINGFAKVEKIMRVLFVRRLFIWPRFHVAISAALSSQSPDVVELAQPMTPGMAQVHQVEFSFVVLCIEFGMLSAVPPSLSSDSNQFTTHRTRPPPPAVAF